MQLETVRGTSPLGAWSYTSWRPPALEGHVDHLWSYCGPTAHPHKRIFPNGCVELLLNFAEPYRTIEGGGEPTLRTAWIGGPQVGPTVVAQPARQDCIAARLRPKGAYAVLARPLSEVTGLSVDLADLVGADARELSDRCAAAKDVEARLRLLARWLAGRIARARAMHRAIAWSVHELDVTAGATSIARLREHAGLSKSRLVAAFRDQVGVEPKRYARIARFHRVLSRLQAHDGRRLVEVAFEGGFYDQAHMNAEFRQLAGITPREFLAARHPVGDGSTAAG
jgi:AraC-like DNA-binding protein